VLISQVKRFLSSHSDFALYQVKITNSTDKHI
jgi:hypothetical protein